MISTAIIANNVRRKDFMVSEDFELIFQLRNRFEMSAHFEITSKSCPTVIRHPTDQIFTICQNPRYRHNKAGPWNMIRTAKYESGKHHECLYAWAIYEQ